MEIKIKHSKLYDIVDSFFILSKIRKKIFIKLNLFFNDYNKINDLSYICIFLYIVFETLFFIYNLFLNEIWYTKLVNICLMLVVPILVLKSFVDFKYKDIINKAPNALDEFQYWLYRSNKIDEAIRVTANSLNGSIKKPFEVLYYNISKNDTMKALDTFKESFSNEHMDNFTEILRTYILNGGNLEEISYQISNESTSFRADNMFISKIQERFFKFKMASVFMIAANLLLKKYLFIVIPGINQSYLSAISSKFTILNIYFIVLYFIIDFFEYV